MGVIFPFLSILKPLLAKSFLNLIASLPVSKVSICFLASALTFWTFSNLVGASALGSFKDTTFPSASTTSVSLSFSDLGKNCSTFVQKLDPT